MSSQLVVLQRARILIMSENSSRSPDQPVTNLRVILVKETSAWRSWLKNVQDKLMYPNCKEHHKKSWALLIHPQIDWIYNVRLQYRIIAPCITLSLSSRLVTLYWDVRYICTRILFRSKQVNLGLTSNHRQGIIILTNFSEQINIL